MSRSGDAFINGERDSRVQEAELRALVRSVDPVWPNAPKAQAFLPLVMMLVVVLPWIHLRAHAKMDVNLAASGLRALDLIDGSDARSIRSDRIGPPIPVWMQTIALSLRTPDQSLAVAAPAALFALLSGVVLYLLGRVWYSPSVGVLAALLLICNQTLLEQIRTGGPGPIVLFFTLASLWPFAEHVRKQGDVFSRWTFIGAAALAGLFLTSGAYAFSMAVLGLGAMLVRGGDEDDSTIERLRKSIVDPTTRAGVVTLLLGTLLAAPWLATAPWSWGAWFPWNSPNIIPTKPTNWLDVISSAPGLIVLAAFGFFRSVRELVHLGPTSGRDALPILWTLLAGIMFGAGQRTPAALLVLTAPLILLASRTILDIVDRKLRDREVMLLAAVAVSVFVVWQTRGFTDFLLTRSSSGKLSGREWGTILKAVVGVVATLLTLTILFRWTSGSDAKRRVLFGGLVIAVIIVACAPGVMLLRDNPRSDDPWYQIQQRLARLIAKEKLDVVLFLDTDVLGDTRRFAARTAVLEFYVRTLAPWQDRRFVATPEDLEDSLVGHELPLVLETQTSRRLPKIYSIAHGSRVLTLTERLDSDRVRIFSPLAVGAVD